MISLECVSLFVHNLITEVNKNNDLEFRYIKTKENPADVPSRGATSDDLMESSLWWNGPHGMYQQLIKTSRMISKQKSNAQKYSLKHLRSSKLQTKLSHRLA